MSRLTLAERIVIECGIYEKLKLNAIAKKIGKTPESISREIRANRTVARGDHYSGKDCHFARECKTKGLCRKEGCNKLCVTCSEYDCRELCTRFLSMLRFREAVLLRKGTSLSIRIFLSAPTWTLLFSQSSPAACAGACFFSSMRIFFL